METTLQRIIRKLELNENTVSTLIGGLVLLIVAVLFLRYFTETSPTQRATIPSDSNLTTLEKSEGSVGETSSAAITRHVVAPNESLWSIAVATYGDGYRWTEIARLNGITNPNLIEKGLEIDLPRKSDLNQPETPVTQDTTKETVQEKATLDEETPTLNVYTVQKSDSLWKIAQKVYGNGYRWVDIWKANQTKISNPNILTNGIVLQIPT